MSFILALILYFATVGFLAGYLLTKLFLGDGQADAKQVVETGGVGVSVTGSTGPVTVDTQPPNATPNAGAGAPGQPPPAGTGTVVSVAVPEVIPPVPPVKPAEDGEKKS